MSNDNLKSEKITLDAVKANWLLNEVQSFIADRPLSKPHVAKLVSEMAQGHFLAEITTIMVAKMGEQTYRLNGQHTAKAVLEVANENEMFALSGVTLLTFTVKDEDELRLLYARIDRGAMRNNHDVMISMLSGTADFADVSRRILKLLPLGLAYQRFEDTTQRKLYAGENASRDVLGAYLKLSQRIGAFMGELNYRDIHHGHMFRGPVVAALYATFVVDQDDAERFWQAVATGVGFESENEPASRLRQLLKDAKISGGVYQQSLKRTLGAEDLYRACLYAWNGFRGHRTFKATLRPTTIQTRPVVK